MSQKTDPPTALIAVRPGVADEGARVHPSQGVKDMPARYSRALHDEIVRLIKRGRRPPEAAAEAGLPKNTFHQWMQLGREQDPRFYEFTEDIERAEAVAEGRALDAITGDDPDKLFALSPDEAKWWLERARAAGYSKEVATKVNAHLEEFLDRLQAALPPVITSEMVGRSIFEMVIAAASGKQIATTGKAVFRLNDDAEEPTRQGSE